MMTDAWFMNMSFRKDGPDRAPMSPLAVLAVRSYVLRHFIVVPQGGER